MVDWLISLGHIWKRHVEHWAGISPQNKTEYLEFTVFFAWLPPLFQWCYNGSVSISLGKRSCGFAALPLKIMGRDFCCFSGEFGDFVSSFWLHLPFLSAFAYLLGILFRFNFSASILFLCFSACLLFCLFFASLLCCFSASSAFCCFFASLLLRFFAFIFFLLVCFLLLLCFSACLLSFPAFLLLWVFLFCFGVCYFSTFLCLMCNGKNMAYFAIKAICHESSNGDLFTHDKDCHDEMDDHALCTMFWPSWFFNPYTSLMLLASLFLSCSSPALGCFSPFCLGAIMRCACLSSPV